jgi:hypothetical protein
MRPGNSPFDKSDISMLCFSGPPARIPEPAIKMKTGSIEMTTKKAKPKAAEPDYVLKPKERDAADKAFSRMVANTTPRLKLVNNKVSIDHPNRVVGELLMMEALGTGDRDFMHGILVQLTEAAGSQGRPPNETDLNFMLSVIKDRKPRDHFECMLATQAAAVHMVAMRFANYLMNSDNLSQQDSAERVFSKATRTFPVQMDAIKRYRSGGEQAFTVQNVSVRDGGQAIVGNVTQNAPAVATDKSAVSPPAITDARVPPMEIIGNPEQEIIPAKPKSNS